MGRPSQVVSSPMKRGVLGGARQVARLVGHRDLEQPAALERGGVHQRRVVDDVLVDLDDLAGTGAYRSLTDLVDSSSPQVSPAVTVPPTSGSWT